MGCSGSKATSASANSQKTLLNSPAEDKSSLGANGFSIFVDQLASTNYFQSSEDGKTLIVSDITGGPLGLWNNRPHTEKVKIGDEVQSVRKAGPAADELVIGDAAKMLEILATQGPFEVVLKPVAAQAATPEDSEPVAAAEAVETAADAASSQSKTPVETNDEAEQALQKQVDAATFEASPANAEVEESAEAAVVDGSKGCGICSI